MSNDVAVHALEVDVAPGPAWAQVASSTHARMSIVFEAIGRGRIESRLKRDQSSMNGPFTMNFAPPGAEVWGYSDGVRRVRDIRLDFDLCRVSAAFGEKLTMPEPQVLNNDRLRYLAKRLAAECESPDQYTSLYIDGLTLAMCVDFLRGGSNGPARMSGRLAPRQLRRVTDYIIEIFPRRSGLETWRRSPGSRSHSLGARSRHRPASRPIGGSSTPESPRRRIYFCRAAFLLPRSP
jgi:hypothetical protein